MYVFGTVLCFVSNDKTEQYKYSYYDSRFGNVSPGDKVFFTATPIIICCHSGIYNIAYIQTSIIYVYETGLSNKTTLSF